MVDTQFQTSPFQLENDHAYRQWREAKLRDYPRDAADLVVEVDNPLQLTGAEHEALLTRVRRANMAIYQSRTPLGDRPDLPQTLGRQLGLERLDHNYLAESSGVSAITVGDKGVKPQFIPYTNRPLNWHSDGYYNDPADPIRAFTLHCVHPAATGGENRLLDHEMVYLLMRDENPDYVRAMMADDIMTIPAREDEDGIARPDVSGPVFFIDPQSGALQMRYTARKRNIIWKDDPLSREAVAWLEALLASDSPYILSARLKADSGLVCNNVLHTRTAFDDAPDAPKRLLYRARYFDRIAMT